MRRVPRYGDLRLWVCGSRPGLDITLLCPLVWPIGNDAIDPDRTSAIPKDISLDRPRSLPSAEFTKLNSRILISGSTSVQTSIPHPRVLFIDGIPGSGKSTAAEAVGGYLSNSRVFAETAPNHPLLVAAPDQMGAAFADIHEIHSADSFAAAALGRLESFLESARCDVLYVFESHPIQSTVRVLFQLDAPRTTILRFWSDLQDRLALVQPRLIYFQESDPLQAFKEIARMRGPIWESYLIEAFKKTPWMQARALSGVEGADQMFVEYADLIDQLADLWRFPMLKLPARPENYEARTGALTKWVMAPVT